jgi:hypothetical protein
MRWYAPICAALLALGLSGCYVSKQPFITAANADYPLKDGARFAAFLPRGKDWRPDKGRTVRRIGDHYVYANDGETEQSPPFLFKRIARNRYVAQMSDSSDPRKVTEFYYQLIVFDGTTAIQYQATCNPRPEWLTRGLIEKTEDTSTERCLFSSLDKLATVLQEAAKNAAPEAKFVLKK